MLVSLMRWLREAFHSIIVHSLMCSLILMKRLQDCSVGRGGDAHGLQGSLQAVAQLNVHEFQKISIPGS